MWLYTPHKTTRPIARMEQSPDVQLFIIAKNDAQKYQDYDASKNKERRFKKERFTEQVTKIYRTRNTDLQNKEHRFKKN